MHIAVKRIYEKAAKEDGQRILVDRLWPRGISKEQAKIDLWFKDIAPSNKLRKWFNHDPVKWDLFSRRYEEELKVNEKLVAIFLEKLKRGRITFVYAAKDEKYNNAIVLRKYVLSRM